MSNVDPTLAQEIRQHPDETFRVIVRVEGDMSTRQGQLEEIGFMISRVLRLVHGFGASVTGTCAQKAVDEEWVISIEPDGEVRALSSTGDK